MPGGGGTRASAHSHLTNLIDKPNDLPLADLPTRRNILQKILEQKMVSPKYKKPISIIAFEVGKMVKAKWMEINHRMEMVMVEPREIVRKINILWQKLEVVSSGGRKKRLNRRKRKGEIVEFIASLDKLFDICSCHCPILLCCSETCTTGCKQKAHIRCSCPVGFKIPVLELEFMHDQRTKIGVHGRFQIGSKDVVESAIQEKALRRKILLQQRQKEKEEKVALRVKELVARKRMWEEEQEQEQMLQDWEEGEPSDLFLPSGERLQTDGRTSATGKWSGAQNRMHFPRTVLAGMRGGVSQRTLANIISSYAVDMGLATKQDPRLLVDHRNVGREQEKQMARITLNAEEWLRNSGIDAFQFDGKDEVAKALVTLECGTKVVRHVKEDHITLTDAQGEFLMHFTREKVEGVKAARVIAIQIVTFLRNFGIDTTLKMIGADSTNVNTGCKEGAIVILERLLGKRLVWSICMLHTNELPLRHLITELDGPTGSANTLTGPVGKLLPITQSLPYNPQFIPLSVGEPLSVLEPEVVADLSWDQQFGYRFLHALEAGSIPDSLQRMVIGPVNHSRWLTTANR